MIVFEPAQQQGRQGSGYSWHEKLSHLALFFLPLILTMPLRPQTLLLTLLWLILLVSPVMVHAWKIPTAWRHTATGEPRLAAVARGTLQGTLRVVLVATSVNDCRVQGTAASNRDVLRGRWQDLNIHVRQLRGPLWHIERLNIQAIGAPTWGRWPWVWLAATLGLWMLRRSWVWLILGAYYYFLRKQYVRTTAPEQSTSPAPPSWRKHLDGEPWALDYQLVLSQDNLQQSLGWKLALKAVLRSIMLNSVLGVAAAAGDAWQQALAQEQTKLKSAKPVEQNPRRLLGESADNSNSAKNLRDLDTYNNGIDPQSSPSDAALTKLLHATDFALVNTRIAPQNRLLLDARASSSNTTSFSYTLRVDVQDGFTKEGPQLVFANPAVCFRTGVLLGSLGEHVLPDVYLPVGPSVAVPLRPRHQLHSVRTIMATDDTDKNLVEIRGRRFVFQDAPRGGSLLPLERRIRH